MCDDISSDRLLLIACIRASSCIRVGHDLVCDDNCDAKLNNLFISVGGKYVPMANLIGKALKGTQELPEMILAGG